MNKFSVSSEEYSMYRAEAVAYIVFLLRHLLVTHEDTVRFRGAISDELGELLLNYMEIV